MLAKLEQYPAPLSAAGVGRTTALIIVIPLGGEAALRNVPLSAELKRALQRKRKKLDDLAKSPMAMDAPHGGLVVWLAQDDTQTAFARHTLYRKAVVQALADKPEQLDIAVFGARNALAGMAETAVAAAWINGTPLPNRKSKPDAKPLRRMVLHGYRAADGFASARADAEGNFLSRELTVRPANDLTPAAYRKRIAALAREHGWKREEFDLPKLKKLGAGAFVAVAQGSPRQDAAIVHLSYRPRGARKSIAVVGKGICFDTGGHNLKPARYMNGMHEDMNGSSVALGILLAATRARLPVNIDCWLALAENHISPEAYRPNEVVTALNGTTIEVVHTDAEGRMVLADTLALAARSKPDLIVDFATLTGSMHVALGDRYSGFFATSDELSDAVLTAGSVTGERMCGFPMDDDYDAALDSDVADVKQCTLEGNADHILAARFLKRFTGERPWIHVDLSGSSCKGGLGIVGTDVTGFGVRWGTALLRARLGER